jgi:hypothetical protein
MGVSPLVPLRTKVQLSFFLFSCSWQADNDSSFWSNLSDHISLWKCLCICRIAGFSYNLFHFCTEDERKHNQSLCFAPETLPFLTNGKSKSEPSYWRNTNESCQQLKSTSSRLVPNWTTHLFKQMSTRLPPLLNAANQSCHPRLCFEKKKKRNVLTMKELVWKIIGIVVEDERSGRYGSDINNVLNW